MEEKKEMEKIGDAINRLMPQLREYQFDMVRATLLSFMNHSNQTPCIVAPTGSGKSWVIAGLCKVIMAKYPDSRSLVLAHRKELVEQNSDKFNQVHADIPFGLYSAGLRKRDIREVTFAGIQSVYKKASEFGKIDLTIIDEAHLISTRNMGTYRRMLRELKAINPKMFIVGLTATPYRTGAGYITSNNGGERLFDSLIETVTISELIEHGYLAPLTSKLPDIVLNVDGVKVRNGDYVGTQLDEAVNNAVNNAKIANEIEKRGKDRHSWLIFAAGIKHAGALCNELRDLRIDCAVLTGKTPSDERREIINDFKSDRLRALINVNVLTTGFDYPNIDLIAGCRPTLSPVLYTQIAGRGMRVKDADRPKDCLYLDFANNIAHFGPITDMKIEKGMTEPAKSCPNCHQLNPISNKKCSICGCVFTKECPACESQIPEASEFCPYCGFDFASGENLETQNKRDPSLKLRNNGHVHDILGSREGKSPEQEMNVIEWRWRAYHKGNDSKNDMVLEVKYIPENLLEHRPACEYLPVNNKSFYARKKAVSTLCNILSHCGANYKNTLGQFVFSGTIFPDIFLENIAGYLKKQTPPKKLVYQECKGKPWDTILKREW